MNVLSRVRVDLNGLSRDTLFDVLSAGAYSTHQLLWRLFPEHDDDRPFLFRQEIEAEQSNNGAPRGLPLFYVLSTVEPVAVPGLLAVESKPFAPALATGDRLAFRLRANPTVARRAGQKRSQRSDVLMHAKATFDREQRKSVSCKQAMDEAAHAWLQARAEASGFKLVAAPIMSAYRQHELRKAKPSKPIRFSSIDYEGVIEVVDSESLVNGMRHGIGRAKAFGCGLMLVRRAG